MTEPRRRSRKPYASPAVAFAAALAVTGICALPPGAIVTAPGTTIWTPLGCDCALTSIVHVPAPSPASESDSSSDFEAAPRLTFMSEYESETGIGEQLRIVRGEQVDLAGARRQDRRLDRARACRPTRARPSRRVPT